MAKSEQKCSVSMFALILMSFVVVPFFVRGASPTVSYFLLFINRHTFFPSLMILLVYCGYACLFALNISHFMWLYLSKSVFIVVLFAFSSMPGIVFLDVRFRLLLIHSWRKFVKDTFVVFVY